MNIKIMKWEKSLTYIYKQRNRWKRGMLPESLLSIKGRSCYQTPLENQDMRKKTTFYER